MAQFAAGQSPASAQYALPLDPPLREARDEFERIYFEHQIKKAGGNMSRLAESVGLERTHLYRKLKQLGICRRQGRNRELTGRTLQANGLSRLKKGIELRSLESGETSRRQPAAKEWQAMSTTEKNPASPTGEDGKSKSSGLMLAAIGVVFGDIGTSPLYTLKEVFHGAHGIAPSHDNVLGRAVAGVLGAADRGFAQVRDFHHARRQQWRGRHHGAAGADA